MSYRSTEEPLGLLLKGYFADFVKQENVAMDRGKKLVINCKGFEWAISSFDPLKTPWPDGVYPINTLIERA